MLSYDIILELETGERWTVLEFLNAIAAEQDRDFQAPFLEAPAPAPAPSVWDNSLPLIMDANECQRYTVTRIHVILKHMLSDTTGRKKMMFDLERTNVELSAYVLTINAALVVASCGSVSSSSSSKNSRYYSSTRTTQQQQMVGQQRIENSVTECMLPFYADTRTAECFYNEQEETLSISCNVLQSTSLSLQHSADIGSPQWLIARAFSGSSTTTTISPATSTASNGAGSDVSKETTAQITKKHDQNNTSRYGTNLQSSEYSSQLLGNDDIDVEEIDPFHLQSPFPWKNTKHISARKGCATSTGRGGDSKNGNKLDKRGKEESLPEDRFHSMDSMSQYLMRQQEEEREEKIKTSEKDRIEREASSSADGNIEYVSADNYRPGGKYSGIKRALESDGSVKFEEHNNGLKKAEALFRGVVSSSLAAGDHDNSCLYKLF